MGRLRRAFRFPRLNPLDSVPCPETPKENRVDDGLEVHDDEDWNESWHPKLEAEERKDNVFHTFPQDGCPEESLAILLTESLDLSIGISYVDLLPKFVEEPAEQSCLLIVKFTKEWILGIELEIEPSDSLFRIFTAFGHPSESEAETIHIRSQLDSHLLDAVPGSDARHLYSFPQVSSLRQ